jgi:hypothetical protein
MIAFLSKPVVRMLFVALTAGLSIANAQTETKPTPPADPLTWTGTLKSENVTESSGLARSSIIPDAFWTMNDSGNGTDVFLFDSQGSALARCEMKGAANIDWEAMSGWKSGEDHFIVVADTGDNLRQRSEYRIYFAKEPNVKPGKTKLYKKSAPAVGVKFRFETGAMNCEAMGIPPGTDEVFFVEKQFAETNMQSPPAIFRLRLPAKELAERLAMKRKDRAGRLPDVLVASKVAEFPIYGVTGMAFSPDGKRVVIRNYLEMRLFEKPASSDGKDRPQDWADIFKNQESVVLPMPLQAQGEAICFSSDSQSVYVTSEKKQQPIWKINIDGLRKQMLEDDQ